MGNSVNWSKIYCRQGQASRRKWLKVVISNIYCFHTL